MRFNTEFDPAIDLASYRQKKTTDYLLIAQRIDRKIRKDHPTGYRGFSIDRSKHVIAFAVTSMDSKQLDHVYYDPDIGGVHIQNNTWNIPAEGNDLMLIYADIAIYAAKEEFNAMKKRR